MPGQWGLFCHGIVDKDCPRSSWNADWQAEVNCQLWKVTIDKIHWFEVYNWIIFSKFRVVQQPPQTSFRTFLSPYKVPSCPSAVSLGYHCQPQAAASRPSVSIDLPFLDISYKCNHTACGPLCLSSFTWHHFIKVRLCGILYQYFIRFVFRAPCQCLAHSRCSVRSWGILLRLGAISKWGWLPARELCQHQAAVTRHWSPDIDFWS